MLTTTFASIPVIAMRTILFADCCNGLRFVRTEIRFTRAVGTGLGMSSRVFAETVSAVDFAQLFGDFVMPASKLGAFGFEVAHD